MVTSLRRNTTGAEASWERLEGDERDRAEQEEHQSQQPEGRLQRETHSAILYIVINNDAQAVHAVQQRQRQQQPVVHAPERVAVANSDKLVASAGYIGRNMIDKQVNNRKKDKR